MTIDKNKDNIEIIFLNKKGVAKITPKIIKKKLDLSPVNKIVEGYKISNKKGIILNFFILNNNKQGKKNKLMKPPAINSSPKKPEFLIP